MLTRVHACRKAGWKHGVQCRGARVHLPVQGAPGQGDPTAAATKGRDLIPPGFASRTVQPNQVGKNCLSLCI